MKHYMDITRIKEKYATAFSIGEQIVVETKIDGSNASFTYDPENGVKAFSRKTELTATNNLRGFYEYVMSLNSELIKDITQNGRYIIFGEWLQSHAVKYPEDMYGKFYMFDVYDTQTQQYLPFKEAYGFYGQLFLASTISSTPENNLAAKTNFVPVIYEGPFEGWEKTKEYLNVNTTNASPCEEGIVIKSQERFVEDSRSPIYLKIVNEKFSEVHSSTPKSVDPAALAKKEAERNLVMTIVNYERVNKQLLKLIDEKIIPSDWDETTMSLIMKNLPRAIIEDCYKEEPEIISQCESFGKIASSIIGQIVRGMLKER